MVSSTPRPHFTPWKDPLPIVQEAGWTPGPVWTGGKSCSHGDSIADRPARSSVALPTELPRPTMYEAYSESKYCFAVKKSSKVSYKILLLSDSTFFKLFFHIFAAIIEALTVAGHKFCVPSSQNGAACDVSHY